MRYFRGFGPCGTFRPSEKLGLGVMGAALLFASLDPCLDPPSCTVRSTPSGVGALLSPVQKSTTEQKRSSFGGVQTFSGERVL